MTSKRCRHVAIVNSSANLAHDLDEIVQLFPRLLLGEDGLRDLGFHEVAETLSQAMDRNFHRSVGQSESPRRVGLVHS